MGLHVQHRPLQCYHRPGIPRSTTVKHGFMFTTSDIRNPSLSLQSSAGPYLGRARSSCQGIQPPRDFLAPFDAPFAAGVRRPGYSLSFDTTIPYDLFGAIGLGSTGHESGPTNDGSLGKQPLVPNLAAETNRIIVDYRVTSDEESQKYGEPVERCVDFSSWNDTNEEYVRWSYSW